MQGYDSTSYGEAFADVYDDWYADVSDVEATVQMLATLSRTAGADLPVVELGVGTGRLALPLAALVHPTPVLGIDSSAAMLARLTAKLAAAAAAADAPSDAFTFTLADMIDGLPDGPLGVVFVAFNTFFNLPTADRQRACFRAVAARLAPDGTFVIEASVPDEASGSGSHVEVKSIAADSVVLSVARSDGASGRVEGQFIEFTESGGVRLRPWSIRTARPAELDEMAAEAGLVLHARWESAGGGPFDAHSDRHLSVYRLG